MADARGDTWRTRKRETKSKKAGAILCEKGRIAFILALFKLCHKTPLDDRRSDVRCAEGGVLGCRKGLGCEGI